MSAFRAGRRRAMCAPCPSAWAAGWPTHCSRHRAAHAAAQNGAPWMTSSSKPSPSGPTCRTATAGSAWTRAATGTCATTARRPLGPFAAAKGSLLRHDKLIDFIQRNYEHDDAGPVVLPERAAARVRGTGGHAVGLARGRGLRGQRAHRRGGRADGLPAGRSRAGSTWRRRIGLGLVHTQDVGMAAEAIEQGRWAARDGAGRATCPARFGYVLSPAARTRPIERAHLTARPRKSRRDAGRLSACRRLAPAAAGYWLALWCGSRRSCRRGAAAAGAAGAAAAAAGAAGAAAPSAAGAAAAGRSGTGNLAPPALAM